MKRSKTNKKKEIPIWLLKLAKKQLKKEAQVRLKAAIERAELERKMGWN